MLKPVAASAPSQGREVKGRLHTLRREMAGCANNFYFGDRLIANSRRYDVIECSPHDLRHIQYVYNLATAQIQNQYFSQKMAVLSRGTYVSIFELELLKLKYTFQKYPPVTIEVGKTGPKKIGFSIITPFYKHVGYFEKCAKSVARAFAWARRRAQFDLEWIVVNDDTAVSDELLLKIVPTQIRNDTRVVNNTAQKGISAATNLGILSAKNAWTVFLDCDDFIRYDCFSVLAHYITNFPSANYISSTVADVSPEGKLVRFRRRAEPQSAIAEIGMLFGHLKAIKRDLFQKFGLFDSRHDGCQDFEFAIKVAAEQPILMIPDPIYYYRWHRNSQSVGRQVTQDAKRIQIIHDFVQQSALPGRGLVRSSNVVASALRSKARNLSAIIVTTASDARYLAVTFASLKYFDVLKRITILFIGSKGDFFNVRGLVETLTSECIFDYFHLSYLDVTKFRSAILNCVALGNKANDERGCLVLFAGDEFLPQLTNDEDKIDTLCIGQNVILSAFSGDPAIASDRRLFLSGLAEIGSVVRSESFIKARSDVGHRELNDFLLEDYLRNLSPYQSLAMKNLDADGKYIREYFEIR